MSKLQEDIQNINYSSIHGVGIQFRDLAIKESQISSAMSYAIELSSTKAYRLARGMLHSVDSMVLFEKESENLIHWARKSGAKERKIIAKVIRKDKGLEGDIYLIHNISTMSKKDARAFIKDYLHSGGDVRAIHEWMVMAGEVLNKMKNGEPLVTRGLFSSGWKWVKKRVSDGASALADGVKTVADALAKAGKSLVDAVGSVVEWTVDKVGDFVTSLIEAGKKIGDILKAALEEGLNAMRKMVEAILHIGKSIAELLTETLSTIAHHLADVLKALFYIGKKLADILLSVMNRASKIMENLLRTLMSIGRSIGDILNSISHYGEDVLIFLVKSILAIEKSMGKMLSSLYDVAKDLMGKVLNLLIYLGKSLIEILNETIKLTISVFTEVVKILMENGELLLNLLNGVIYAFKDGVKRMVEALSLLGKSIYELLSWAFDQKDHILREALEGLLAAGKSVVDIFSEIASKMVNGITRTISELITLGKNVVELIGDAIDVSMGFIKKFVNALGQVTGALAKFASEVVKFTYHSAAYLVKKMLDAGLAVAEILTMVVGESYLVFRRVINGVIQNTGSVGEVLDWVLSEVESGLSTLWHNTLLSIRYAKGKLTDAVDWAVSKGDEMIETILMAWESVKENLVDFYAYAIALVKEGAEELFSAIGKATVKLGNSVSYLLHYLEKDFIPGVRDFVKGLLEVGYELVRLLGNLVGHTYELLKEVVAESLSFGVSLGELIVETIKNPEDILDNVLKAVDELGHSLSHIYDALLNRGDAYLKEVTETFYRMKRPAKDILHAVAEVSAGAVGTVAAILLNLLASYRAMSAEEIREARKVYGDSLDYTNIYFSEESFSNDILRAVHGSRAFVTNNLVNFDTKRPLSNATMIHELCHVWQYQDSGAFYMAEAIHAQEDEGYNYGYTNADNGDGGEVKLNEMRETHPNLSMKELFERFNREQQAQIVKHYYVRRYENNPSLDYAAWEPYREVVYA